MIDPSGATVASAPPDHEAILVHDIAPRSLPELPSRRPALYGRLLDPTASLPVSRLLAEPIVPRQASGRVAVVAGDGSFDPVALVNRYEAARRQGADLVVVAGGIGPEGWQVELPRIEASVRTWGGALAFAVQTNGCAWTHEAALITPEGSWEHNATHGRGIMTGEIVSPIVETAAGNVALLCGEEGLLPEVARCLALEGADILAWPAFAAHPMLEKLARTRSDENRVYTALAWPGGGMVVAPTGQLLTAVPDGSGITMTASTNRALSRWKEMAPGTNVIADRQPRAYTALTRR